MFDSVNRPETIDMFWILSLTDAFVPSEATLHHNGAQFEKFVTFVFQAQIFFWVVRFIDVSNRGFQ